MKSATIGDILNAMPTLSFVYRFASIFALFSTVAFWIVPAWSPFLFTIITAVLSVIGMSFVAAVIALLSGVSYVHKKEGASPDA